MLVRGVITGSDFRSLPRPCNFFDVFCVYPRAAARTSKHTSNQAMVSKAVVPDPLRRGVEVVACDAHHEEFSNDWQAYGRCPQIIPPLVKKLMTEVLALESELGEKLVFGGPRGSLQGRAKACEEHRHRAFYGYLPDSEEKLQFYAARQVACRILGCRGYLCQNCWLPYADCMCEKVKLTSLWPAVRLWLYMHPKDYLRKNNSGKLLWQVFGGNSVRLCVFGIQEQENEMWSAFERAGREWVWYLYPEQEGLQTCHVNELKICKELACQESSMEQCVTTLNFILIDGTWSNSKAMINRLQARAKATWQQQTMQSVSLSLEKLSVLHDLRPQPSLDRTCTAAAATQLLRELDLNGGLASCQLAKAANALDAALGYLLEALSIRRERMGLAVERRAKGFKAHELSCQSS